MNVRCPLMALSGHRLVRCTCPLLTQSGHQTAALPLFATGLGALGLLE